MLVLVVMQITTVLVSMIRLNTSLVMLSALCLCGFGYADDETIACQDPVNNMQGVVNDIQLSLKDVCQRDNLTRADVEAVIQKVFIPKVDIALITRQILGRQFWSKSTDDEKKELEGLLSKLLSRQYAEAFNCKYLNNDIQFYPLRGDIKKYTRVEASLELDESTQLLLRYALRCKDTDWRVYDVVIDGLSLSQTYRSQFNRVLQQGGIKRLNAYLDQKLNKEDDDI